MAVSTPVKSIWVNPRQIANDPESIGKLARAMGLNEEVLANNVTANAEREFLYVKRRLSPADADTVLAMGLRGVYAQQEYQRYYPQGEVSAHLVGFTNVDDQGQEGLELAYEDWLSGRHGSSQSHEGSSWQYHRRVSDSGNSAAGATICN